MVAYAAHARKNVRDEISKINPAYPEGVRGTFQVRGCPALAKWRESTRFDAPETAYEFFWDCSTSVRSIDRRRGTSCSTQ